MSDAWIAWSPELPQELNTLGTTLETALTVTAEALSSAQALLQGATVPSVPTNFAEEASRIILDQAVLAIQNLIRQFTATTGVYTLAIPLPKKTFVNPAYFSDPADQAVVNPSTFPLGPFLRDLPEAQRARIYSQIDFTKLFDPASMGLGGNPYLIKTFMDSLYDAGDSNRPKWEGPMYWAYAQFVAGGTDVLPLLNSILFLDMLYSGATGLGPKMSRGETSIVPTRVTARMAPAEGGGVAPVVVVEWPPIPRQLIATSLDDATVVPTRLVVIRSTDFRSRNALNIIDLLPGGDTSEGATGNYDSVVVTERAYDGIRTRVVDRGPFVEGKDYYYHVAFKTRVTDSNGAELETDYDTLSAHAVCRYSTRAAAPLSASKPPDWMRTPSLGGMIPQLAKVLYEVNLALDGLRASGRQLSNYQTGLSDFTQRQAARYAEQARRLSKMFQNLSAIFRNPPTGGIYARVSSGQGTVASLMSDYMLGLTDVSDTNRPQLDQGSEFAASMIVLVIAPDPAPIAAAYETLRLLFNSTFTSTPEQTALQQINQTLATAEAEALAVLASPTVTPTAFPLGIDPACSGQP